MSQGSAGFYSLNGDFQPGKCLLQLDVAIGFAVNFMLGLQERTQVPLYQTDFVNPIDKVCTKETIKRGYYLLHRRSTRRGFAFVLWLWLS